MSKPHLNPFRYFDPDPTVRKIAYDLYSQVKDLPYVCPHGHVDPKLFSKNNPFPDPAELFLIPDHYVFRLLYSQGISFESLGKSTLDGTAVEPDHRKIWQTFADNYYLFAGTPTGTWLSHEFTEVFGIPQTLTSKNAMEFYDELQEKLQLPENLPRALYDRFNIEVLTTTDSASDLLTDHKKIMSSAWDGRIIPCFRPDGVVKIGLPEWRSEIDTLSQASGIDVNSYPRFIQALENRREFFKSMGAVSTDYDAYSPYTHRLTELEADSIIQRALKGEADEVDAAAFLAHMLMEMARMSIEDGLVMQMHTGIFRNHNESIMKKFGPDMGGDIPVQVEFTRNLHELLNCYGNDKRLSLIVFTIDESTYARELAPLAGYYPALKIGPAWWYNDSIQGMTRYRELVTETASIYNTVGFNDDTRALPSIPARHDLNRRIDNNYLAQMVVRHIIVHDEAHRMSKALAYDLVKKAYRL